MITYKSLVCWDCGMKHGAKPGRDIGITIWRGICAICGEDKDVSPFYDYGGPKEKESDMPTFESLKAEHPEWCWKCGREHQSDGHYLVCTDSPIIAALTAKCLEDEATIRELEGCLIAEQEHTAQAEAELSAAQATIREKDARIAELITQRNECARLAAEQGIKAFHLSYDLSAEQAAHAATKEELRKAVKSLSNQKIRNEHLQSQVQRAADAAKEK